MVQLRAYQQDCLHAVRRAYHAGRRRVLVSLPTGTGKTVVFAQFPRYFAMKHRLLVLAHREELLEQARAKFLAVAPDLKVDIEQSSRQASPEAQVVIGSVATLGRKRSARLARLDPSSIYLVVVDEAHHAVAPTYRRVFDHFGLLEEGTPRMLVGFTATPYRGDKQRLGEVFEDIAYSRGLREMVANGHLCPIRGWRVSTDVSLDGVRIRRGDFVESQLAAAVDVAERNAAIIRAHADFAPSRRVLVFCVNVAHSKSIASAFRDAGVAAAAVWGEMPKDDRRETLRAFGAGELQLLTNCNLLTEGFDQPRVDCVVMARPTQSKLLYAQMVGRGTRLHPDKEDLVVIDICDNTAKHKIAGLHQLFDLPANLSLDGHNALEVAERAERIQRRFPWLDLSQVSDVGTLQIAAERIDLLRCAPPDEVRSYTTYAWYSVASGDYHLPLPNREELVIRHNLLGGWDVTYVGPDKTVLMHRATDLRRAMELGDRFVTKHRAHVRRLVDMEAEWRDRDATQPQREFLERLRIPVPPGLNRGQASWIIALAKGRTAS
jgi:superfamily II DNA or RNA helicase